MASLMTGLPARCRRTTFIRLTCVSGVTPAMRLLHISRLITPEEFDTMRKYDVTGIGLNLGTAEDFVRKTGVALPKGQDMSQVGSVEGSHLCCVSGAAASCVFWAPCRFVDATADMCCLALQQPSLPPHD